MSMQHDYTYLLHWRQRNEELIKEAEGNARARQGRRRPKSNGPVTIPQARPARLPAHWNVTGEELADFYPCDRLASTPVRHLSRGLDVDAPADVLFRWLCQLRVAPYSYDWIDNFGRRSPRTLTPGLEELETGQSILIGAITDFAVDDHITGRAFASAERLFGLVGLTYRVVSRSPTTSRLVVRLVVHEPNSWGTIARYWLLAWGDLIMMRKQLMTLKVLAERSARDHDSVHAEPRHRQR